MGKKAEGKEASNSSAEGQLSAEGMKLRWLACSTGNAHVLGPCPSCFEKRSGLLMGTVGGNYKGRLTAKCVDCGRTEEYYVDAEAERIWRLEEVGAKGARVDV